MTSQSGKQTIVIHILSKREIGKRLKFGQLIECNM